MGVALPPQRSPLQTDPARRRGRPLRLPEDLTPVSTVHAPVENRIAWLLAVSRVYATAQPLDRVAMVEALQGLGIAADKTRLSKWESGQHPASAAVLAGYESALGKAPGALSVVARGVQRALDPGGSGSLNGPISAARPDLDVVLSDIIANRHTGESWTDLTDQLVGYDLVYLDRSTWRSTAGTLASELGRSVGLAYVRRYEALRCLVRHKASSRHAVRELVSVVTDPGSQAEAQALTLLQEVDHPRVNRLALSMLRSERPNLSAAAFRVCAAKLARGQLVDDVDRVAAAVASFLNRRAGVGGSVDAIDALVQLPRAQQERVMVGVPLHDRKRVLCAIEGSELAPSDVARRISGSLAADVQASLVAASPVDQDTMLERLIREALFHTHQERRHHAGLLLGSSPYAEAIAGRALALAAYEDDWIASRALNLLLYVGAPRRPDLLWALADGGDRPVVRAHAMLALAHQSVAPPEEVLAKAGAQALLRPDTHLGVAAVHLLGMHGSSRLEALAAEPRSPISDAAGWWLIQGPAIHEPTDRAPVR
jgi:hypothetical protein